MGLGRLICNNLTDENTLNEKAQAKPKNNEKNYLALATQLMTQMKLMSQNRNTRGQEDGARQQSGDRTYLPWRFENLENKTTKEVRGSTMQWCSNDCHEKPMWCGRKKYLNRADYSKERQKKMEGKSASGDGTKSSSEFKIALAAITSTENFEALEEQFASLKE